MKTTLITGANRGIGLELCRLCHERGDRVIAVCRTPSPDLEALGVQIEADIDLLIPGSISTLTARLNGERIDLLINNAGILTRESLDALDYDAIQRQFEVNTLGPLRVTEALIPLLADGAKIGMVTSRMGSIADNTSGGAYGYRISKAALNIAGVSLAHDLKDRGISVALLHPGHVSTELTGHTGNVAPQDAAAGLLARLDALDLASSGGFWHANGESLPW